MISRKKVADFCQRFIRKSLVICCGFVPPVLIGGILMSAKVGCSVSVNGKVIGTAPSEEYVIELIEGINEEFSPYLEGNKAITVSAHTEPRILIGESYSTRESLAKALKSTSPHLEKAYSVKSNGKIVAAFETEAEMKKCYNEFVTEMTKDSEKHVILDDITFEYENVPRSMIESADAGKESLSGTYEYSDVVDINARTEKADILMDYCITESEFEKLNPDYEQGSTDKVIIKSEIPYIRILTVKKDVKETVMKHKTEYKQDSSMPKGETVVDTKGIDGVKEAEQTTHSVNGQIICRKTVSEIIKKPRTEVLVVGTKEPAKGEATGKFISPYAGILTSPFGQRWGRMHRGVDIAGSEGADIVASDGGVVVFAGWNNGGYGYMVKIDHGNGYSTLYAHCSEVYVEEGQQVCKGEVISALGNTGRSTGPHVHFEIINTSDGSVVDPLNYFSVKPAE